MKTFLSVAAVGALAMSLALSLGGCQSLSPELKGLAHTPDENRNMVRVANNQNARSVSDDLARTFYVDHPSRLSPFPITYTSGMPR